MKDVAKEFVGANGAINGGLAPRGAPITPQDLKDVQENRKFIYLWGWMRYFDVFPKTTQHITHFCWFVTVIGDPFNCVPMTPATPPTASVLYFNYLQYSEGNYAD